jgi:hypothetical protein
MPPGPNGNATLFLPFNYLTLCGEIFGSADLEVTVLVEGMLDGTMTLLFDEVFDIDNDDQDPDNLELAILVPTEGTYMVTVTSIVACHECCSANNFCGTGSDGEALFFGETGTINATTLKDPTVELMWQMCDNCGC